MMQDIRCGKCHKKLGEGQYLHLKIKCPRCGTLNNMKDSILLLEHLRMPDSLQYNATQLITDYTTE